MQTAIDFDYNEAGLSAPPNAHQPVPTDFSPRRYGVLPIANSPNAFYKAEGNSSFDPSQPKVVATRLTQKELKEPLGHSPIRGTGAARFGIMPEKSSEPMVTAGKATNRNDTVATLLGQNQNIINASNSARRNQQQSNFDSPASASNDSPVVSGREGSPRAAARANARQTTFSSIPGGSENINTFRFGQVVHSDDTAKSIISPRFQETHVTASPDKVRSRRKFGARTGDIEGDKEVRLEPSALPAACLPTKEGVANKAAFSAIKAKDTLKDIVYSCGSHQKDDMVGKSSGKVTSRDVPPITLPSPRRQEDPNDNHQKYRNMLLHSPTKSNNNGSSKVTSPTMKNTNNENGEGNFEQEEDESANVNTIKSPRQEQEVAYGMPTARKGVEPPALRKLTDAKNYGDEPSSGDLVLGGDQALVARLLTEKSLTSSDEAVAWANKCDFGLSEEEARYAYVAAAAENSDDGKSISLHDFKLMVDLLFP